MSVPLVLPPFWQLPSNEAPGCGRVGSEARERQKQNWFPLNPKEIFHAKVALGLFRSTESGGCRVSVRKGQPVLPEVWVAPLVLNPLSGHRNQFSAFPQLVVWIGSDLDLKPWFLRVNGTPPPSSNPPRDETSPKRGWIHTQPAECTSTDNCLMIGQLGVKVPPLLLKDTVCFGNVGRCQKRFFLVAWSWPAVTRPIKVLIAEPWMECCQ